jgi:hypothetical protein
VRVVQIHDSKETVIGSTKVVTTSGGVIVGRVRDVPYKDATTWTVDLAEGDLLQFELWDHNDENPDQRIFACKADLTMLDPSEQTCSGFVNGVIGELIGTISAVLTPKE